MSTEKQERLLKNRPDIVVATPGRLWELMSGGEQHLAEVRTWSGAIFFSSGCFSSPVLVVTFVFFSNAAELIILLCVGRG